MHIYYIISAFAANALYTQVGLAPKKSPRGFS